MKLPLVRRWAFWLYALILFTATHWPSLTVPGPPNTDKFVHIAAFGLWTALFIGAGFFGAPFTMRNVLLAFVVAPAYAAIDESSQALPFIHRSAEFADYFANLKGILFVCLGALVASKVISTRRDPSEALSSPPNERT